MTFQVFVDWEDNGSFADAFDDISDDVMEISWRLGMRNAFQLIADEMTLQVQVKNADGKYNPENTGGTLYGYLLPQRKIKVQHVDGGGTTVMYYGYVEFPEVAWRPSGTATGKETAMLHGVGSKHLLEENQVTLPLYQDVTGDQIIEDVLNASTLPASVTNRWVLGVEGNSEIGSTTYLGELADFASLETGAITIPYYGDVAPPSAWSVIDDLTLAEQGRFFFDRDGIATWWNRYHLVSITDNGGTVNTASTNKPTGLDYTYGTQLANSVKVEAHPRNIGASEILWELDTTVTINPGEVVEFEVRLRKDDGQFAGASELTSTPTFQQGDATVKVAPLGGKAKITITNESGTTAAVLTGLTLTGAPVTTQNDLSIEVWDDASVGVYGKRSLTIDTGSVADFEQGRTLAEYVLAQRKDARGEVNSLDFVRQNDGADDTMLLDWPIGTRIRVVDAGLSHDSDYFVIGEEHKWMPGVNGGVHSGTLRLEPADVSNVWILGVSGRSEIGSTTILG